MIEDYTIHQYLKYQETIKTILTQYSYIGDYNLDKDTQFLWRKIMLSDGTIINFDTHKDLMYYINNNFVTSIRFEINNEKDN